MAAESLTIEQLRDSLVPVFRRYSILRAILFGSRARGEASRRSDADLILVQRTSKRFLDRYDGILRDLNLALPETAVEALIYTPQEFEQMRSRQFLARALREGVVLYESD
jgi:uncharacterized protein